MFRTAGFDLSPRRRMLPVAAAALLLGWAALGAPAASGDASVCPSDGAKTLMLADGNGSSLGFGCGYLDNWEEHSIGGMAEQHWESLPAPGYVYDYVCDHQTGDIGIIPVTTQGQYQYVGLDKPLPVVMPSVYYSATNTATSTRHWGVGVLWNTGNPHDGVLPAPTTATDPTTTPPSLTVPPQPSYTKNCGSPAGDIPSYVLYQTSIPSVTPSVIPPATKPTVGQKLLVSFKTSVYSKTTLPNGQQLGLIEPAGVAEPDVAAPEGNTAATKLINPPDANHPKPYPVGTVTIDSTLGALAPKECVADAGSTIGCAATQEGLNGASAVAVSPNGKTIYAASSGDSAVTWFTRDATTGALTPGGCIADAGSKLSCASTQQGLGGARAIVASADGKSVYVIGGADNAVTTLDRDPVSGALTGKGCISDAGQSNCGPVQQGLGGVNALAVSADGKSLYTVANGDDAIARFDRDPATGALTPKGCISDAGQSNCKPNQQGLGGSIGVTVSPDGTSVYTVGAGDDAIVSFTRDPATGALTGKSCISDTGQSNCGVVQQGLGGVAGVTVTADNKSVYTVGTGDDAIVSFTRDPATGALTGKGCISDLGQGNCDATEEGLGGATAVTSSPDGKTVYTAAAGDDAVTRFDRDSSTGALTPNGCFSDVGQSNCETVNRAEGIAGAAGVAVNPDGLAVFVVGTGDDALVRFSRSVPKPGQPTSASGGGTLVWVPQVAGTYTLQVAYGGLNVAAPDRGYTAAASAAFTVTVDPAPASRSVRLAAPWPAATPRQEDTPVPPPVDEPTLGATQRSGIGGGLSVVNSRFAVPKTGTIPSQFGDIGCPKGSALVNVEAGSTGKNSPAGGITIRSSASGGASLTFANSARGFNGMAQLLCRRTSATRPFRHAGFVYGTVRGDRITVAKANRVAFGGLGADRLTITGTGSSAVGGLGGDTITLRAGKSSASGGPGNDVLRSTASRRTLLNGGLGKDRLIGSRGPTLINAADGRGGDTVVCHSAKNRVAADAGDRLVGPCKKVTLR